MVDTLSLATDLAAAGMPRDQADATSRAIAKALLDEVATRKQLDEGFGALRGDMLKLRTELRTEIHDFRAELKAEIQEVRTELKVEIQEVRAELQEVRTEVQDVRGELKQEIQEARADIQGLRSEMTTLRAEMEAGDSVIRADMRAMEDRLLARIDRAQLTTIMSMAALLGIALTAFRLTL